MPTDINDINELQKFICPRFPPYIWDFIGYGGGLLTIFYYDNFFYLFSFFFVIYGLLNMFFDFFSVSFDYSNNKMPNYKNIGNYNYYITNKKYVLENKEIFNSINKSNTIDDSKLKIELSIYVGEKCLIKYILFFIYLSGITKKNYAMNNYNDFKDNRIRFV